MTNPSLVLFHYRRSETISVINQKHPANKKRQKPQRKYNVNPSISFILFFIIFPDTYFEFHDIFFKTDLNGTTIYQPPKLRLQGTLRFKTNSLSNPTNIRDGQKYY